MLDQDEKRQLLKIARQALVSAVTDEPLLELNLEDMPENLRVDGASFVTLTNHGQLRGCIGALEAYQPLVLDVQEHAIAAATEDYRFPPVDQAELPLIEIEISRLTPPERLEYGNAQELLEKLRPGVDGVVLRDGMRRATFLPQVWEKVPNKQDFLEHLCIKMGMHPSLWREKPLDVFIYQVEEFREEE